MCDNIISELKLGLDGLFTLPVSLLKETSLFYETFPVGSDETAAKASLEQQAQAELRRRIGEDGEVISQNLTFSRSKGCMVATLLAECLQDIATEKPMTDEEIDRVRLENSITEEENTQ